MNEPIDFTKLHEFEVEVFDDELGTLGPGTLRFGPESWIHIDFGLSNIPKGEAFRSLKAKTSANQYFTLFNCKRTHFSIGADYVVSGNVGENFKSFRIRYSDISEWYLPWQRLDGNVGEAVSWINRAKHLAATVKTEKESFALTSKSDTSITRSGEDHILHEHVLFCLEHLDGHFSPEEIRTKAMELSNLLSILIAYPLSIISIQVVCENGLTHSAFFSTFKRVERDASDSNFSHKCFIQQQSIHDRWEAILNRYFNSEYRKVSWTRLAGMQRYEGFWEYMALGYVTLLDKYVDQRYRESGNHEKIPVPISAKKKTKLGEAIKDLSLPLDGNQRDSLMEIVSKVFAYQRDPWFSEKYRRAISESNQDMMKIIDISEEDFELIKEVRDRIAHGEALDLPDDNFGRISSIVHKIELLLTYWAFFDFGLTNDDFLHCLVNTSNPLRFRSQPNTTHINRLIKPENFFSVSKEMFDKFSGIKGIRLNACFTQNASGIIDYSEEHSTAYKKWQSSRVQGLFKHADIFGVEQERIKYVDPMYIECGDESLTLSIAWVIQDA